MASNTTAEPDSGSGHKLNCPTTHPGTTDATSSSSISHPASTSIRGDLDGDCHTGPSIENQLDVQINQEPLFPEPSADSEPAPSSSTNLVTPSVATDSLATPATMPSTTATTTTPSQAQPASDTQAQTPVAETLLKPDSEAHEPKTLTPAIGPSSDLPCPSSKDGETPGSALVITLLLTTGARHPFKIDGRYLRKRAVNVPDNDPFSMSVYTLKELIWREWRSEWEPRPSSPSLIRLISFGKLLEDKAPLSDSRFNRDAPNVVHMTVKPQDIVDEEDSKAHKNQCSRDREETERSPGCRCVIL